MQGIFACEAILSTEVDVYEHNVYRKRSICGVL